MKSNPFILTFGIKTENYIHRTEDFDEVTKYFDDSDSYGKSYIITGVRGSGKTALLTEIMEYYKNKNDWMVIELL